jgi:small subunit ribosomal protein S16
MLKIRLKRVGRKHDPSFRVVLVDSHEGPKTGKINEILGFYDPKKDIKELKADNIKDWIRKGAQVSDTVHNILVDQKIIEGKKVNVLPKKRPVIKEAPKEEAKAEVPEKKDEAPNAEIVLEAQAKEFPKEEIKEKPTVTESAEKPTEETAEVVTEDSKKEEDPTSDKPQT